jgi:lipid-binding SYLF domain-containing protein
MTKVMPAAAIVFLLAALGTLVPVFAAADDALDARHLAERAQQTLETFSQAPEMDAFRNLIRSARGVFIAPQILKGAFFIGASGGSGVFVARDSLTGRWLGPAFYTIGAASFGLQFGGSASEVVLLAMTDRGVNALLESSIKLGADVGVAAGPVGIGAAASTENLSVDVISFSRSKGLFGGIAVDGAIVKTRSDWNNAYYGAIVTPVDIFRKRIAGNPYAAGLLATVSRMAGGSSPVARGMPSQAPRPEGQPQPRPEEQPQPKPEGVDKPADAPVPVEGE